MSPRQLCPFAPPAAATFATAGGVVEGLGCVGGGMGGCVLINGGVSVVGVGGVCGSPPAFAM